MSRFEQGFKFAVCMLGLVRLTCHAAAPAIPQIYILQVEKMRKNIHGVYDF